MENCKSRVRSPTIKEYANDLAFRSLDADILKAEGLGRVDLLMDGASSDWLEEVGTTMH